MDRHRDADDGRRARANGNRVCRPLRQGRTRPCTSRAHPGAPCGNRGCESLKDLLKEEAMKTNYLAVTVCAIVYWLIGGLWYAVLFGKLWTALEPPAAEPASDANRILPYIITFLLNLLIAFVLAQICIWRNANTASRGAAIGVLLWIGFVGPITFTSYMYEMRPMQLFAINEFYSLVGLSLMGLILGAWTKKAT